MRTTLEIDPRVLAAARAQVSEGRSRSIGEAVSQFALDGLSLKAPPVPSVTGLVMLPVPEDHIVTNDMVAKALADD